MSSLGRRRTNRKGRILNAGLCMSTLPSGHRYVLWCSWLDLLSGYFLCVTIGCLGHSSWTCLGGRASSNSPVFCFPIREMVPELELLPRKLLPLNPQSRAPFEAAESDPNPLTSSPASFHFQLVWLLC